MFVRFTPSLRLVLLAPLLFAACAKQPSLTSSRPGAPSPRAVQVALAGASTDHQHHHGLEAAAATDPATPAATFTCPMHPEVVSDKPGSCPICGMKLVPKKDGK